MTICTRKSHLHTGITADNPSRWGQDLDIGQPGLCDKAGGVGVTWTLLIDYKVQSWIKQNVMRVHQLLRGDQPLNMRASISWNIKYHVLQLCHLDMLNWDFQFKKAYRFAMTIEMVSYWCRRTFCFSFLFSVWDTHHLNLILNLPVQRLYLAHFYSHHSHSSSIKNRHVPGDGSPALYIYLWGYNASLFPVIRFLSEPTWFLVDLIHILASVRKSCTYPSTSRPTSIDAW